MRKLIIKKASIKNNIKIVKERSGSAAIYAVLTGNGNGAGVVEMARLLRDEGITRFAVCEVEEAAALRKAGLAPPSKSASGGKRFNAGFLLFTLALLATFVTLALVLLKII